MNGELSHMPINRLERVAGGYTAHAINTRRTNLSPVQDVLRLTDDVRQELLSRHPELLQRSLFEPKQRGKVETAIEAYLQQQGYFTNVLSEAKKKLSQEICGLGPIDELYKDTSVTDIMVNGYNDVWVRNYEGKDIRTEVYFDDEDHVRNIASKIANAAGKEISLSQKMITCEFPGARVNITIYPVSVYGTTITIRKFAHRIFSVDEMIDKGGLSQDAIDFLVKAVKSGVNGIIAGAAESGKTTFLRNLMQFSPDDERIVGIEIVPELRLKKHYRAKNIVEFVADKNTGHVTLEEVFENALHQNVRRFVFGEIRGSEAMLVLESMNTGHYGWTTMHGTSALTAMERLIMMCLRAEQNVDPEYNGKLITNTLDIVIHMDRFQVKEIAEVTGFENGKVILQPLFVQKKGRLVNCGKVSPSLQERVMAQ